MADPAIDTIAWKEIMGGALMVCTGLLTYIVKKNDKRVEEVEKKASSSASVDALEQHRKEDRENFQMLFKGQADLKDTLNGGFKDVNETLHGIHTSMLEKINEKADRSGRRAS